jgi:putative membrane protein
MAQYLMAIALMLPGGIALAQTNAGKPDQAQNHTRMDDQFAKEAASGGMAEVKLGQLAQEKGSNEAVKNFGSRMVNDHSKAADELKAAATQSNINLPSKLNARDEATYNRLSRMSGSAFDREYAKTMVTDHTQDVAEFRKEAIDGQDASIRNFASETLPTLQEHLKQAREMEKAVSGAASNNSKPSNSY